MPRGARGRWGEGDTPGHPHPTATRMRPRAVYGFSGFGTVPSCVRACEGGCWGFMCWGNASTGEGPWDRETSARAVTMGFHYLETPQRRESTLNVDPLRL